jgi:hypothetical protein
LYYSVRSAYWKWINFPVNCFVNHWSVSFILWSNFVHYLHHVNKMNTWWIDLICSSMFHVQNSDDFDEFWSRISTQILLNNRCCQLHKFCVTPNLNVVKTLSITAMHH